MPTWSSSRATSPWPRPPAFVRDQPYSRYPVTGKDFDDVIGFVHVRDLLDVRDPNAKIVRDVVREGISLPRHLQAAAKPGTAA